MAGRVIGTATVQVRADVSHFRGSLNGLDSAFGGIRSSVGRLAGAVAAIGIGHMASEAIGFGAQTTMALDRATAMFRGLTGSESEAQEMLQRLTQYAINTPFELPGLSNMAAQLLAVGKGFGVTTENVTGYLDTIGNVTAASGGSEETMQRIVRVLGQMSSSGKVLGQDMNQLAQNIPGLDVWGALAEGTGKSREELRKLQDEGKLDELLTGNEAVNILLDSMTKFPGAAGAMERRMDTLEGSVSKFKEQLAITMSQGLQPFFAVLRETLGNPAVLTAVNGLVTAFAGLATSLMSGLAPALPALVSGLTGIMDALGPLGPLVGEIASTFGRLLNAVAPIIGTFASALGSLAPILAPLGSLVTAVLGTAMAAVTPILEVLAELILQIARVVLPPLTRILQQLEPVFRLVGDAIAQLAMAVLPPFIDGLGQMLTAVSPLIPVLGELLGALLEALLPVFIALAPLMTLLVPVFVALVEAITPLIMIVAQLATILITALMPVFEGIAGAVEGFADVLTGVVETVAGWVEAVAGFFQWLYDVLVGNSIIPDLINGIIEWFGMLTGLISFVSGVFSGIYNVVSTIFNAILSVVSTVVTAVVSFVTGAWNALSSVTSSVFGAISGIASSIWNGIRSTVTGVVNGIRSVVEGTWNAIQSISSTIWNGIKTAVTNPIEAARGIVSGVVDTIRSVMSFSGLSAAVSGAWNAVKSAITGPIEAAVSAVQTAVGKIKSAVTSAIDAVKNIPGAGVVGNAIGFITGHEAGGIVTSPTLSWLGEKHKPEAVIPLTNPGRAMQLMQQSGLDRLAARMNTSGGISGPLVTMPGAVIQDATDADLVAQRTLVAMQAAMVA